MPNEYGGPTKGARLNGKVALVTGGSSGIGEAIAVALSREGAAIHLNGTSESRLRAVTARLDASKCTWTALDLAESARVASLVDDAIANHGRLDILVNCGALLGRPVRLAADETTLDLWQRTLAVNLTAPFVLSVAALGAFKAVGGGSIINVASIGGLAAFPRFAPYVVSKAALIGLTKSMAVDFGRDRVRVNAIAPGAIETHNVDEEPDRSTALKAIADSTALDRIGQPSEIGSVAVFLASDDASYITGEVIVVDGGRLARA